MKISEEFAKINLRQRNLRLYEFGCEKKTLKAIE
jgi:hypothetical protein